MQPLKEKESREIGRGLLKCFLLLETVFPAICNMGVEMTVANCANALRAEEQKRGRERNHQQKEDEIQKPRVKKAQRDKPKGRGVSRRYDSTP